MDVSTGHANTIAGAVIGIVTATVNLALVFGVHLTQAQQAAIIAEATALTIVAPLIGAFIDHSKRQATARLDAATEIGRSYR